MFRFNHLFERFQTRRAVVPNFADKMGRRICVERSLEIVSRSPEVIFGYFRCFLSAFEDLLAHVGRAGQIGPKRVKTPQHFRQNFTAYAIVIRIEFGVKRKPVMRHVVFVVSAPERHAGVMAQAVDYHLCFLARLFQEIICLWVKGAAEHEVVPHHDSQFVASIVKCIRFVNTATPDSEHIAVQVCGH